MNTKEVREELETGFVKINELSTAIGLITAAALSGDSMNVARAAYVLLKALKPVTYHLVAVRKILKEELRLAEARERGPLTAGEEPKGPSGWAHGDEMERHELEGRN